MIRKHQYQITVRQMYNVINLNGVFVTRSSEVLISSDFEEYYWNSQINNFVILAFAYIYKPIVNT